MKFSGVDESLYFSDMNGKNTELEPPRGACMHTSIMYLLFFIFLLQHIFMGKTLNPRTVDA